MLKISLATLAVLLSFAILAQADDAFQVSFASNLNVNDSLIDITNTGATVAAGVSQNLCANVYVFDPAEEEVACCSCSVTPNGLVSAGVKSLVLNTLTPAMPTSVVVKLVASTGVCNASSVTSLAHGMQAWMTTTHLITTIKPPLYPGQKPTTTLTPSLSQTQFAFSDLSAAELAHITSSCGFIQSNGSGFGICGGCTAGGQ